MKILKISGGKETSVDDDTFEWASKKRWTAQRVENGRYYAARYENGKYVYLHQLVLGRKGVDHRDSNGLNDCRTNLRGCTQTQNNANRSKQRNNQSGFKGVTWDSARKKWKAQVGYRGKNYFQKRFDSIEEAARACDKVSKKLFGEFARLNFPNE